MISCITYFVILHLSLQCLSELEQDSQVRDVLSRIKQHIDVLEQAAARVSSGAEVYGAVQQVCSLKLSS